VGQGGAVQGVRYFSGPNYTRVVLDLSAPTPFAARRLAADADAERPHRVYLDLQGGRLGAGCPSCVAIADGLVRQLRVGQNDPSTVRVVLDLAAPAEFRAFPLDGPPRIVLDILRDPASGDPVAALLPAAPHAGSPRRPRVVLDPGHGGRDPGALGIGGVREKEVTLAIAREVSAILRRQGRWEVKLTREGDTTLSLEERTAIANAFGADLFVSIHANASPSHAAQGVETYYLERSSDRSSRRLAAAENGGREEDAAEMEHILADVVLNSKVRDSRRLAQAIQDALVSRLSRNYGPTRDLGVKRGPFYVLTGAVMPAVLVETAFLSHPEESRRLVDAKFRRETAQALAQGINRFTGGT
jgi:N-acetylmuramoyl-L-alanine amidase